MKFERNMSFSAEEFSDGEVLLYATPFVIRFISTLKMRYIRKKRLRIQFMRNLREHKYLTIRKTKKGADLTKSIVKSAPKAP